MEELQAGRGRAGEAEEVVARLEVGERHAGDDEVRIAGGEVIAHGERIVTIGWPGEESGDGRGHGHVKRVGELRDEEVGVVWVGRGVYGAVPGVEGRVRLLRGAAAATKRAVVVHVPVGDEGSHRARVIVDGPRAALRRLGVRVAEPGDRFGPESYVHCFFDEEALLDEIERAGLVVVRRRGFWFVLRAGDDVARPPEDADGFALEVPRVLAVVRAVDAARRSAAPKDALASMRARGAQKQTRGPIGRARLRRAIGWVDALARGGGNCYRRVLCEIALDAGAASETVVFGLDVGRTGHIAFEDREERSFDVTFEVPPS